MVSLPKKIAYDSTPQFNFVPGSHYNRDHNSSTSNIRSVNSVDTIIVSKSKSHVFHMGLYGGDELHATVSHR